MDLSRHGTEEWNGRLRGALVLYAFAVLGVFLLAAPWTAIWEQAALALVPEHLRESMLSGWVRGAVSGLGAFDLALALQAGLDLRRRTGDSRRRSVSNLSR